MMRKSVNHYFLFSGFFGFISYLLHDILGSILYPGYEPARQAVSDLTALDSPVRDLAASLSNLYGLFSIMTMISIVWVLSNKGSTLFKRASYTFLAMHLLSSIGYGLFPLSTTGQPNTFTDIMHIYVVTIPVVLLSIVSLILFIMVGKKESKPLLLWISSVTLLFMFLGAMLSNLVDQSMFGIVERFSTYSAVAFTAFLGIYVFHLVKNQII